MAKQPKPQVPSPVSSTSYRLYVLANGHYLAAQEMGREHGTSRLKDPALVAPAKNGMGFVFTPVQYVQNPILYEHAVMMEDDLPPTILASYLSYQEELERERHHRG